jgi:hypothetical protein
LFQIKTAIKSRKEKRKLKKEGMRNENVEKMRGIIRDSDDKYKQHSFKKVSFDESAHGGLEHFNSRDWFYNAIKNIEDVFEKLYNFFVVPFVYVTFRNIGIQ